MSVRVLAAVIARGDRYLICRRPAHKRHAGLWEFPGGKLESGESLFDAAVRELREELDVTAASICDPVFSIADAGSEFIIEFVPTEIHGEPRCIEHTELQWATVEELLELDLAPSDRRFAEFIRE